MTVKTISILGCGWLGLPLADSFLADHIEVRGSATSLPKTEILKAHGIEPFIIDLANVELDELKRFIDADVLIVAVPPRSRKQDPQLYTTQIRNLVDLISQVDALKHVIYTSSTSVYKDMPGLVREEDVLDVSQAMNKDLFEVEQLFLAMPHKKVSILRLGGLTGGTRMLAKHFAGRTAIPAGLCPVNLVHVEDVIAAIRFVVAHELEGIFNVCAPSHPSKKDFYTHLCMRFELDNPEFDAGDLTVGKTVDSIKLLAKGYQYTYPDPSGFTYEF